MWQHQMEGLLSYCYMKGPTKGLTPLHSAASMSKLVRNELLQDGYIIFCLVLFLCLFFVHISESC